MKPQISAYVSHHYVVASRGVMTIDQLSVMCMYNVRYIHMSHSTEREVVPVYFLEWRKAEEMLSTEGSSRDCDFRLAYMEAVIFWGEN